jgi:hypothetical protein
MKLYFLNLNSYFSGITKDVEDEKDSIPFNSVTVTPPNISENEYLRWNFVYNVWDVTEISPEQFEASINEEIQTINWNDIRNKRNSLIVDSDRRSGIIWPDVWMNHTEEYKTEWVLYRQQLRDLPETFKDSISESEIVWPKLPGSDDI